MGIYSNGTVYGIRIYRFNDDGEYYTLFDKRFDDIMSDDQKKEAYLYYCGLENKAVLFQIYTECCSTYDMQHNQNSFMKWMHIQLDMFVENFGI